MNKPNLLLIDGFNLLSRGYFATSYGRSEEELSTNSEGLYTNGLRVFFQKLLNLITEHQISHVAVAWDVKREDSVRRQYAPTYKETRNELPQALIQQYETSTRLLEEIGIKQITVSPYEADDAIGALSCLWSKRNDGHCYIYSNDRDLLQLLDHNTTQIIATKQGELLYTANHFTDEYGITPTQWIDVKALLGDKSDNIPGCPGVGEKSALPLIQQYGSVEGVYEQLDAESLDPAYKRYQKKLLSGRESSLISKRLATIICDIPELAETNFSDFTYMKDEAVLKQAFDQIELKIKV
ncbi:5'-3' exonuclease [Bacillus sp. FJAT-45037]|uniref:5'-3' exonuclease n=1 Tax=Bacillus sp. FJAT-45037 TaxID=2011007 RepID=UPI000C230311|nr:5'-3' exonuclease H3TH domain-containing protein [Bacillus sp. FJAT-45037]